MLAGWWACRLSTSEIKGYEKDVQQLRQQNRVMHESLDLLQNKLISLLLTAKRAPEPSQGTTEPQEVRSASAASGFR